jgi:hypothetical protein
MPSYSADYFAKLFTSLGAPKSAIPFMVSQVAHETGDFKSLELQKYNNATGIIFLNSPKQKNASRGDVLPESPQYNYAVFDTIEDWARDYMRILSIGSKPPIKASTLTDFVTRLKNNKYFGDTIENYLKGLKRAYDKYGKVFVVNNLLPLLLLSLLVYIAAT